MEHTIGQDQLRFVVVHPAVLLVLLLLLIRIGVRRFGIGYRRAFSRPAAIGRLALPQRLSQLVNEPRVKTAQAALASGGRLRRTTATRTGCLRRTSYQRTLRVPRGAPRKLRPRRQVGHVHRMTAVPGRRTRHKLIARRRRQTRTVRAGTLRNLPAPAGTLVRTLGNSPLAALVDVELVLHHRHHKSHLSLYLLCPSLRSKINTRVIRIDSLYTS